MKKFFIAVSVLMALTFFAGPSNALIGVEDPVQGNSFRVPFLVEMGAAGLDTLVIYQETSTIAGLFGTAATPAVRGVAAWILWTPRSVHAADGNRVFTRGDVDSISIRDIILNFVGPAQQAQLEIDLDGDGVNDHYYGYFTVQALSTAIPGGFTNLNNIMAYVQFVDLANGQAAGTLATMYEVGTAPGYALDQISASAANGAPNAVDFEGNAFNPLQAWEVMTPNAYTWSAWRERGFFAPPLPVPPANEVAAFIRFTPRWYLHDATGESYVFIYKGLNHAAPAQVNVNYWDNNEFRLSGAISLPNEMNIINMRTTLPAAMLAAYPAAGWIDIRNPDILGAQLRWPATLPGPPATAPASSPNWDEIEWTCWVWNTASSPAAGLNWSALWVDKEVGTL